MPLFERVFALFNRMKPQFYALYQNDSRLSKTYVKRALRYLDKFYAVINEPKSAVNTFTSDLEK